MRIFRTAVIFCWQIDSCWRPVLQWTWPPHRYLHFRNLRSANDVHYPDSYCLRCLEKTNAMWRFRTVLICFLANIHRSAIAFGHICRRHDKISFNIFLLSKSRLSPSFLPWMNEVVACSPNWTHLTIQWWFEFYFESAPQRRDSIWSLNDS